VFLGFWIITLFGLSISGAHYNPGVTLAHMFRSGDAALESKLLGIIYIIAQFAGGLICAFGGAFLLEDQSSYDSFSCIVEPIKDVELSTKAFTAMSSECLGTFVYVTFFLMCSDKRTRFSNDKVINSFILAAAFVASRLISGGRMVTGLPQGTIKVSNLTGDPDELEDLEITKYLYSGPLLNTALAFGQQLISLDFTYIL